MKVFVFAYNRYDTMTTSRMLEENGVEHIVLCHSAEDKARFISGGTAKPQRLVATGNPKGLTHQRNSAIDMMKVGEWALFLNDDLQDITMLYPYYDNDWQKINITQTNIKAVDAAFRHKITLLEFVQRCERITQRCDKENIHLAAFVPHDNTQFRARRVSHTGLADGRAWLIKKEEGVRFDTNVGAIEDHEWTARHLERDGKVYIDNWICPKFARMSKGGYGSLKEREQELRHDCTYLIQKYPDIFEYREKAGYPSGTQIRFKKIL